MVDISDKDIQFLRNIRNTKNSIAGQLAKEL